MGFPVFAGDYNLIDLNMGDNIITSIERRFFYNQTRSLI